jgi:hypothetical protein
MAALLCAVAMLVVHAARLFGTRFSLFVRECHADAEPELPLRTDSDLMEQKTEAAGRSRTNFEALAPQADDAMLDTTSRIGTATSLIGMPNGNSLSDRNSNGNLPVRPESQPEFRRRTGTRSAIPSSRRSMLAPG